MSGKIPEIQVEVILLIRDQVFEDDWEIPQLDGITFPVLLLLESSSLS